MEEAKGRIAANSQLLHKSMPDGPFKFICHYCDLGIKFEAAGALIQKTCRAVALFLFELFTLIGPPKTLKTDNGREFNQVALDGKAEKVYLDEEFIDGVITELCMLWPNSSVVRGTPRHSEPNGGIKRRNLTFETRLGAMVLNEYFTKHWSVMYPLLPQPATSPAVPVTALKDDAIFTAAALPVSKAATTTTLTPGIITTTLTPSIIPAPDPPTGPTPLLPATAPDPPGSRRMRAPAERAEQAKQVRNKAERAEQGQTRRDKIKAEQKGYPGRDTAEQGGTKAEHGGTKPNMAEQAEQGRTKAELFRPLCAQGPISSSPTHNPTCFSNQNTTHNSTLNPTCNLQP
eukprot:scaffold55159_cov58-Cyclotella_meneghiniana.AAC.4